MSRGKGDDIEGVVVAVAGGEVVAVAAGGSDNKDFSPGPAEPSLYGMLLSKQGMPPLRGT